MRGEIMGTDSNASVRPFGMKDKLGYMFGDFGNDFTFILSSSFMLKFYTDVMGISAGLVGGLMMAARFIDAFTDVTMGAEYTCDNRHTGTGKNGVAVHCLKCKQRRAYSNYKTCKGRSDGSPGRQFRPVFGRRGYSGSHGAIGNIDGCIEYGAPQYVGNRHPEHLEAICHICKRRLINQKRSYRYRTAHPFDPGPEFAVFGGLGTVHNLPHGNISKSINKTGRHHQAPCPHCRFKVCSGAEQRSAKTVKF